MDLDETDIAKKKMAEFEIKNIEVQKEIGEAFRKYVEENQKQVFSEVLRTNEELFGIKDINDGKIRQACGSKV